MVIYNHAVIVWTDDGKGRTFNDIPKADKYFDKCAKEKKNPTWQRIERTSYYG